MQDCIIETGNPAGNGREQTEKGNEKMTFTEIKNQLEADGNDAAELDAMLKAFEDADSFSEKEYYQNQLYGFICGLAALRYITPDDVNDVMNRLDCGIL